MKTNLTRLFIALPFAGLLAACARTEEPAAPPPPMPVPVASPVQRAIVEYADYTGQLEAVESVTVRPRVGGYIQSIHFEEGEKVTAGDLLYIIDPRPFEAQFNRLDAQVRQAEAALDLAQANLQRAENLIAANAISQEEVDIRQSEALQAEANLIAAQAELEAAELDLGFTQVTAPIDGIADRHFVTLGNLVTSDVTELTTIVPHDPIFAYYEIDERSFLRNVRAFFEGESPGRGSDAQIPAYLGLTDEDDFPHEGVVDFASNQVNPNTATMTVRARFENENEFLTPGLFARIRVPISPERERLLIPDAAIGTDQTIRFVWVINAENVAERRTIELGPRHETYRVVRSGLTPEDRIAVSAIQFIRPGMTVDPQTTEI